MNPATLLSSAVKIARLAADKILAIYHDSVSCAVTEKNDQSPLTEADQLSHKIIVRELSHLTPGIAIISEESSSNSDIYNGEYDCFWLVDPLDGTKEFIERNNEFTVNIALVAGRRVILGVVHVPVSDTSYYANEAAGAFKKVGGDAPKKILINSGLGSRKDPIRLAISRRHGREAMLPFMNAVNNFGPSICIPMGSSLKICAVAEGSIDIYPRLGPTKEWDTAAAQCVLEEAGGQILDHTGQSLLYNKQGFLNSHFLAIRNGDYASWAAYL